MAYNNRRVHRYSRNYNKLKNRLRNQILEWKETNIIETRNYTSIFRDLLSHDVDWTPENLPYQYRIKSWNSNNIE